jgi:hypothetical protein
VIIDNMRMIIDDNTRVIIDNMLVIIDNMHLLLSCDCMRRTYIYSAGAGAALCVTEERTVVAGPIEEVY